MSTTNENGTSANLPFDEELCERYLFGELTEAEQERFETAYFDDDSFFNNFLAVKDEVLDLYSRNELDPEKRRRMEPHFLSTNSRRKRLAESRDFVDSISSIADRSRVPVSDPVVAPPKPAGVLESLRMIFTPFRFAAAGILVAVLAVGLWTLVKPEIPENIADSQVEPPVPSETTPILVKGPDGPETDGNSQSIAHQSGDQPSQLNPVEEREVPVNPDRATPSDTIAQIPGSSPTPRAPQMSHKDSPESKLPDVATKGVPVPTPELQKQPDPRTEIAGVRTETVTLDSASRSANRRNTAEIGSATQNVVIRMVFGGGAYSTYSVRISTVGGGTVWRASNLRTAATAGTKTLAVTVPANSLSRKDYIVVLEGRSADGNMETIREYYLHIDRQ